MNHTRKSFILAAAGALAGAGLMTWAILGGETRHGMETVDWFSLIGGGTALGAFAAVTIRLFADSLILPPKTGATSNQEKAGRRRKPPR